MRLHAIVDTPTRVGLFTILRHFLWLTIKPKNRNHLAVFSVYR
jgi:hypothetical protein